MSNLLYFLPAQVKAEMAEIKTYRKEIKKLKKELKHPHKNHNKEDLLGALVSIATPISTTIINKFSHTTESSSH